MIGRIFRVVRTPLTLLLLLGVLLYGAWWGYNNIIQPVPPAPEPPCVEQTLAKGQLKTSQITVRIFNGGDRKGLAAEVGRSLRGKGFKVALTTNTQERVQKTVIVGASPDAPEVKFVKTFLKDAVVRTEAAKAIDHSVDILVGNRYGGFNKKAKTTYKISSASVCLPSQAASTPALGG